ncbi:MAG: ABC transporter ATP-binding protein [Ruminococcaceae bacterium]|nr:ABC transporter ATP-binding protein [Oscillospiraceae bacterium]
MIRIEEMYKIYKMGDIEVRALNGVSLHIKQHEFVAIVGPSGSGKSTLMNMIGALDTPTSGKCFIDGQEISQMSDNELALLRNKKLGFIFQQYNLLPRLNAIENVELPLTYAGYSATERRHMAKTALERVGLGDKMHHKPSELSGGQQQRVSIARALSSRPQLILADEPTGALDSKSGIEVMAMLKEIHAEGKTIVIITHDNNIAKQANRIIRIADGEIVSDADTESATKAGGGQLV